MASEEQINQLTQLGPNAYEAKAYLALLGRESSSATQVADLSGVPRQRIYDILASLTARSLAVSRPSRHGTRYTAVAPQAALTTLLAEAQQRMTMLQSVTTQLIDTLGTQYAAGQTEHSPLQYIEVLRGQAAISQRFAEIQANCKQEILIFTKPPYTQLPQENVEGLATLKHRIRARSLYEYDVLDDEAIARAIAYFVEQGEEARFVEHLPLKLVIVDEELVMFAMEDPVAGRTDLTIMVVEHRQLAQVMKLAFETLWERGVPLDAARAEHDARTQEHFRL